MKTYIIAEAGVNHNKDLKTAFELVDEAQKTGADVVKFQLELPNNITPYTLTWKEQKKVADYCEKVKMPFACTAFDVPTLKFLLDNTKMEFIKIASCDHKNIGLAAEVLTSGLPIIQSLKAEAFSWSWDRLNIRYLHVVAEYPTPAKNASLLTVTELWCDGLSDHSIGIHLPLAAVALGAQVIEKHFTLSNDQEGPDHKISANPKDFTEMVRCIREIEVAL